MKKTFRLLAVALVLVLCLVPVLVACETDTADVDDTTSVTTTAETAENEETTAENSVTPDKDPEVTTDEQATSEEATDPAQNETEETTNPAEDGSEEATDPAETDPAETDPSEPDEEVVFEGTRVGKSENIERTMTLVLHQLADPDASTGNTACSLVLYDSEGNVLNYVLFEYVGNGKAPNVLTLKNTVWDETNLTAYISNANGTNQSFEMAYSK